MASHKVALKEAAVVITWGKLVAPGKAPPNLVPGPTLETPWRASDHHSYPFIPSRGTAAAPFTSNPIFSCNVSLPIRSPTLLFVGRFTWQNVKFLLIPSFGSHAKRSRASLVCEATFKKRTKTVIMRDVGMVVMEMFFSGDGEQGRWMCGVYIGEVKEKEEKEHRENVFVRKLLCVLKTFNLRSEFVITSIYRLYNLGKVLKWKVTDKTLNLYRL